MAIRKFKPSSPDRALGKIKGDAEFARFAHLNRLVDDVEVGKANQETGLATYGYEWYPDASVISTGPKYVYTDGTTLYGYKIIGMRAVPFSGPGSDHLNEYVGTLVMTNSTMANIFPGKISGTITYYDGTNDLHFSPLSSSAYLWDDNTDDKTLVEGITINFYPYGDYGNETWYAVVIESDTVTDAELSGVINYEVEFSYPSDFNNTTFKIIQD